MDSAEDTPIEIPLPPIKERKARDSLRLIESASSEEGGQADDYLRQLVSEAMVKSFIQQNGGGGPPGEPPPPTVFQKLIGPMWVKISGAILAFATAVYGYAHVIEQRSLSNEEAIHSHVSEEMHAGARKTVEVLKRDVKDTRDSIKTLAEDTLPALNKSITNLQQEKIDEKHKAEIEAAKREAEYWKTKAKNR